MLPDDVLPQPVILPPLLQGLVVLLVVLVAVLVAVLVLVVVVVLLDLVAVWVLMCHCGVSRPLRATLLPVRLF